MKNLKSLRTCKFLGCKKKTEGFWCKKHSSKYKKKGTRLSQLKRYNLNNKRTD